MIDSKAVEGNLNRVEANMIAGQKKQDIQKKKSYTIGKTGDHLDLKQLL